MPTTLKISDELLQKLGATATDFEAKVEALLTEGEAAAAKAKDQGDGFATLVKRVDAMETTLKAVQDGKVKIDASVLEMLTTKATEAGTIAASKEVSAAIAKAGGAALGGGKKEDDKAEDAPDKNDPEAVWKASKDIRDEFITLDNYKAFHKATNEGRVIFHSARLAKQTNN